MSPSSPRPTFNAYSTNVGHFIKIQSNYYTSPTSGYYVNGIAPSDQVIVNGWAKIDGPIVKVQKMNAPAKILLHYKIQFDQLVGELPKIIELADVVHDDDGDVADVIPLKDVKQFALYEPVYEETPGGLVDVDFEVVNLGTYTIEDPTNLKSRKIKLSSDGSYCKKGIEHELANIATYDELTKILTPEFAMAQVPCSLTSKQMYRIVRQHIIENLDYKENTITSNYDFCFTVKKRVHTKPFVTTETYYSGRKLKTRQVKQEEKLVEVFEMTWAGYKGNGGYGEYTCIPGMSGNSLDDLYMKVTKYLDDLLAALNQRVRECECCGGTGNIIERFNVKENK